MNKSMNDYVSIYQRHLKNGDIQIAYQQLIQAVMALKARFLAAHSDRYQAGNVSPGYLDFTYFSFFDAALRSRKLRFGIVLNHKNMRFELWLMGQNAAVQKEYWALLKTTRWNLHRDAMPQYSVLETVLVENPDFDDREALFSQIIAAATTQSDEILGCLP